MGAPALGALVLAGGAARRMQGQNKALLRLATLYNVPTAINRSSADFLISSPLFEDDGYVPVVKDYKAYVERVLK